ncbi:unnamed protein product [Ilex paraguariensis]|uniref:RING-type domain-containing protein n=1 Tax=Ilex paraguariensis TaxID=185542 RepID=A0ABC8SPM2_9AQUA
MAFPSGHPDFVFPNLLLQVLKLLGFIQKLISIIFFPTFGLSYFREPDTTIPSVCTSELHSVSAVLIRELLPVVKFSDLIYPPESCSVCLHKFCGSDEIRQLINCKHIFHRSCLDRWMDHNQTTCPLCRTSFIPDDMQEAFNERLWAASEVSDEYKSIIAL